MLFRSPPPPPPRLPAGLLWPPGAPGSAATAADAHTLPAAWYTSRAAAALEAAAVFGASWQLVCRSAQLRRPGDFVTGALGGGGPPFLLAVGDDGAPRAFANVCRHHAAAVAAGAGAGAEGFTCPYHGWRRGAAA